MTPPKEIEKLGNISYRGGLYISMKSLAISLAVIVSKLNELIDEYNQLARQLQNRDER